MKTIAFVMGLNCTGKTCFLDFAEKKRPDAVGAVRVGKMLRSMFPPDYFEGQAAPAKTQDLAWQLCRDACFEHAANEKQLILVDGQPRALDQVEKIFGDMQTLWAGYGYTPEFVLLTAEDHIRRIRLMDRDGSDEKALKLGEQRLINDKVTYYDVLSALLMKNARIRVFDTSHSPTPEIFQNGLLNILLEES